nr:small ribosomal subunit Rsm22 family protein [Frankia tisae]
MAAWWRAAVLAADATITDPCPADGACPLPGGDWCHVARRVERSALHRMTKDVALGHEDEKYTYLVASRRATPHAGGPVAVRPGGPLLPPARLRTAAAFSGSAPQAAAQTSS